MKIVAELLCRGIGPEASDRFHWRFVAGKCALPANKLIVRFAGPLLAMTDDTFCEVDGFALFRRPTARRQADAIRTNADIPCGNFFGRRDPSEIRAVRSDGHG